MTTTIIETAQAPAKKLSPKEQLVENWSGLLNAEGAPEIVEGKEAIMAKIFETQEKDFATDPIYTDREMIQSFGSFLAEAEIAGDHGYNPQNIAAGQASGAITNIGPAVMGMVRRTIPNMMALDIAGTQPLTQSSGQYFALRAVYNKDPLAPGAKEAFHPMHAPDAMYSGQGAAQAFTVLAAGETLATGDIKRHEFVETGTAYLQATGAVTIDAAATDPALLDAEVLKHVEAGTLAEIAEGMATSIAELQEGYNGSQDNPWNEMSFRIDKQTVEAKARQLKASYSIEVAQDLRAVHGMDADAELSGILATEITLEVNREIVDWVNYSAQIGKTGFTRTEGSKAGVFDFADPIDVKGARWQGEAFKALLFQIDKEAVEIGRQTGRGAANFIIASRNVVNALASVDTGVTPAAAGMGRNFNVDTAKSVFAGVLGGRYKVYIDLYSRQDYFTVGYKGTSELDAGIYFLPYVALTPLRAQDPKSFHPILGFKTRYAIGINPMAFSAEQAPAGRISNGMPTIANSAGKNAYFRKVWVKGL